MTIRVKIFPLRAAKRIHLYFVVDTDIHFLLSLFCFVFGFFFYVVVVFFTLTDRASTIPNNMPPLNPRPFVRSFFDMHAAPTGHTQLDHNCN